MLGVSNMNTRGFRHTSPPGSATTADWIAHFWADRPGVPVEVAELAELAFRAWLSGPGRLPAEFAPSRNAGQ